MKVLKGDDGKDVTLKGISKIVSMVLKRRLIINWREREVDDMIMTLYTKSECSLCEVAKEILMKLRKKYTFDYDLIDIKINEILYDYYKDDCPVLCIEGWEVFKGRVSERLLENILQSQSRERR